MSTEEKLAGYDESAAALIDRELPGMGRAIVVAAKAMFEAEHGPDAYANATVPRRAHYRFLATLALRPAISRLSAEVQKLRAERDMAERAAAEAAIPLEALMMAGQGYLSDAVWDEVRNGVGHVRSMLAARAMRRAALKPETGK